MSILSPELPETAAEVFEMTMARSTGRTEDICCSIACKLHCFAIKLPEKRDETLKRLSDYALAETEPFLYGIGLYS